MAGYLLHYSGVERLNLQVGGPGEEEEEEGQDRKGEERGTREGGRGVGILYIDAACTHNTLYMF